MGAHRLAADCLRLLGAPPTTVTVVAPHDRALAAALAAQGAAAASDGASAAIVSFRGARAHPAERQACLTTLRARLPAGAPLLVVDHNQPRTLGLRLAAVVHLALAGLRPGRARYPAARGRAPLALTV